MELRLTIIFYPIFQISFKLEKFMQLQNNNVITSGNRNTNDNTTAAVAVPVHKNNPYNLNEIFSVVSNQIFLKHLISLTKQQYDNWK